MNGLRRYVSTRSPNGDVPDRREDPGYLGNYKAHRISSVLGKRGLFNSRLLSLKPNYIQLTS